MSEAEEMRMMMTYASDFWPQFWTIIIGCAALTVLACLLLAVIAPSGSGGNERIERFESPAEPPREEPARLPNAA